MKYRAFATILLAVSAIGGCSAAPAASPPPSASRTIAPTPSPLAPTAAPTETPAPIETPQSVQVVMTSVETESGLKPAYVPAEITATAGDVVFVLDNQPATGQEAPPAHNFILGEEPPKHTGTDWVLSPVMAMSRPVGPNKSEPFAVEDLAPGTYGFWCNIEGHFTSGMIGTLTVTP